MLVCSLFDSLKYAIPSLQVHSLGIHSCLSLSTVIEPWVEEPHEVVLWEVVGYELVEVDPDTLTSGRQLVAICGTKHEKFII